MTTASILAHLPMPAAYFRLMLQHFGVSAELREQILLGTGIDEMALRDPSLEINLQQQVLQMKNLGRLFGDQWALSAPDIWSPSAHGALGLAVMAAPNIAAMVDVMVRYGSGHAPFYKVSFRKGAETCHLDCEITAPLDEDIWRKLLEIAYVGIRASIVRAMTLSPVGFQFSFTCAEPANADQVRAILGPNVDYKADRNAVRFPISWLDVDSPFHDTRLYRIALDELQTRIQPLGDPVRIQSRVVRILSSLPASRLSADEIARSLGVSRRTLVRRLGEAGASFRQLVDDELRQRAEALLRVGGRSHAELAEELGYRDPSSFSRACRRWFGSKSSQQPKPDSEPEHLP